MTSEKAKQQTLKARNTKREKYDQEVSRIGKTVYELRHRPSKEWIKNYSEPVIRPTSGWEKVSREFVNEYSDLTQNGKRYDKHYMKRIYERYIVLCREENPFLGA